MYRWSTLREPTKEVENVCIASFTREQVLDVEQKSLSPEKLAINLLFSLFSPEELKKGNCTKPV